MRLKGVLVALLLLTTELVPRVVGTVLAAKCASGIVIGTDSLDLQGPLVDNRYSEKVFRINPMTLICAATYNSDIRNLCNELRRICLMHRAECDEVLGVDSVAHLARQLVHGNFPDAHVLVVGCDGIVTESLAQQEQVELRTPKFSIHEVLPGGTRIEQDVAVAGSASALIATLIDQLWKVQAPPSSSATIDRISTIEAAVRLKQAVRAAIKNDPGSGGEVTLWSLKFSQTSKRVTLQKLEV